MRRRVAFVAALSLVAASTRAQSSPAPGSQRALGVADAADTAALLPISTDPRILGLPAEAETQVASWTKRYASTYKPTLERAIERAQPWAPMIAAKLRAAGLPAALVYLPIIESGYHPWARSHAGAVGLWQFMPATARAYGLRITPWLDERRDPLRATDAAVMHLRDLHRAHRDWYVTLASYNAGSGRVGRATRSVQVSSWSQRYWAAQALLPTETRNYVPQILAVARIGADPASFGIDVPRHYRIPSLIRIPLPPASRLDVLARVWGVPVTLVAAWNPALRWAATPPSETYAVAMPADNGEEAMAKRARFLALPASQRTLTQAQIASGGAAR